MATDYKAPEFQTFILIVEHELLANERFLPDTAERMFDHLRDIHRHTTKDVTLVVFNESQGEIAGFVRQSGTVRWDWKQGE